MRNRVSNTGGVTYDQIFRAIGDPHRLQILTLLHEKELSAGEILKALDVVQSTLSHHMKSLVDAGVVSASRHGKWTYYSLNTGILEDAVRFLGEFTDGTKVRAEFAPKEENHSAQKPVLPEVKISEPAPKPSKAKENSSSSSDGREEKKKSKKGKKGKKNKK